jgi:hypothetical protein
LLLRYEGKSINGEQPEPRRPVVQEELQRLAPEEEHLPFLALAATASPLGARLANAPAIKTDRGSSSPTSTKPRESA